METSFDTSQAIQRVRETEVMESTQPTDSSKERRISQEDYFRILQYAGAIQESERIGEESRRRMALEGLTLDGENYHPTISLAFRTAESMKIKPVYVKKAIVTLFPTKEEMQESLRKIGAKEDKYQKRERISAKVIRRLKETFPGENFYWESSSDNDDWTYLIREQTLPKQKIFGFITIHPKQKSRLLETHRFNGCNLYSPAFLQACEPWLVSEMKGVGIISQDITYHYPVEE